MRSTALAESFTETEAVPTPVETGEIELRGLLEQVAVDLHEFAGRCDAQLLSEGASDAVEVTEGLALSTREVQRYQVESVEVLPVRVLRRQRGEVNQFLGVTTEGELHLDETLDGAHLEFVESRARDLATEFSRAMRIDDRERAEVPDLGRALPRTETVRLLATALSRNAWSMATTESPTSNDVPVISHDDIRQIALSLPGTYEQASFGGRPSFRTKPRMFCWIRADPEALMVFVDSLEDKEMLLASDPDTFFTIPHYDGHAAILVNLDMVEEDEARELITDSWHLRAPKTLVKEFDAAGLPPPRD